MIDGVEVRQITKDSFKLPIDQRKDFLLEPVVKPETFGNERYLRNLSEIYQLVVENGQPYFSSREDYFIFTTTKDVGYIGQVGVKKGSDGRIDDRYILMKLYPPEGFGYHSSVNISFFDRGVVTGSFKMDDGTSVSLEYSPCKNFDSKTIDFLDKFTTDLLKEFNLSKGEKGSYKVAPDFYKGTLDREKIETNLQRMSELERESGYLMSRSKDSYLRGFLGLSGTLEYIKSLGQNMKVVDIGTGKGEAWFELSRDYGNDLRFMATNLTYREDLVEMFKDNIKFTSAELMDGFNESSVGGMLAMNSIAFCASPKTTIETMDKILVPGGIIKAGFRLPSASFFAERGLQTHHRFTDQLLNLGYDVVIDGNEKIILAIKPGGKEKAVDIFRRDIQSLK